MDEVFSFFVGKFHFCALYMQKRKTHYIKEVNVMKIIKKHPLAVKLIAIVLLFSIVILGVVLIRKKAINALDSTAKLLQNIDISQVEKMERYFKPYNKYQELTDEESLELIELIRRVKFPEEVTFNEEYVSPSSFGIMITLIDSTSVYFSAGNYSGNYYVYVDNYAFVADIGVCRDISAFLGEL